MGTDTALQNFSVCSASCKLQICFYILWKPNDLMHVAVNPDFKMFCIHELQCNYIHVRFTIIDSWINQYHYSGSASRFSWFFWADQLEKICRRIAGEQVWLDGRHPAGGLAMQLECRWRSSYCTSLSTQSPAVHYQHRWGLLIRDCLLAVDFSIMQVPVADLQQLPNLESTSCTKSTTC